MKVVKMQYLTPAGSPQTHARDSVLGGDTIQT